MFELYVVGFRSKNGHQKKSVLKGGWTTCSKHADHFEFNCQHNWEGGGERLYDHLMNKYKLQRL